MNGCFVPCFPFFLVFCPEEPVGLVAGESSGPVG